MRTEQEIKNSIDELKKIRCMLVNCSTELDTDRAKSEILELIRQELVELDASKFYQGVKSCDEEVSTGFKEHKSN